MGLYFWVKDFLSRPSLGWVSKLGAWPLTVAAWSYGHVQALRRWAYRRGVLRSGRAPVPVISVGNIMVGGTGKTPCVEAVCRLLQREFGRRPAVLSRGYGGRFQGAWGAVSDGTSVLMDPETAGDEPVLLARRLPGVPVLVGRDRRVTAREAGRFGADVLVMDDGFQHLRLGRDLDILTVDVGNPFGNGHCLPRGLLRELPRALADADVLLLTRTRGVERERIDGVRHALERYNSKAPVLCTSHVPVGLVDVADGTKKDLAFLQGLKVLAFAGIGQPEAFFRELEALGTRVLETVPFPDHHQYGPADVEQLERWSGLMNAQALVTTEKDAVRLRSYLPGRIPLLALQIRFEVDGDPEPLRRQIARVLADPRSVPPEP